MYFLKKNITAATFTEESIDCLPRLSERTRLAKFKDGSIFDTKDHSQKQK